jgi:hypothetical protein
VPPGEIGSVYVASLPVRTEPSPDAPAVVDLAVDDRVLVLDDPEPDWMLVQVTTDADVFGWVPAVQDGYRTLATWYPSFCPQGSELTRALSLYVLTAMDEAERDRCLGDRRIRLYGYVSEVGDPAPRWYATDPTWLDPVNGLWLSDSPPDVGGDRSSIVFQVDGSIAAPPTDTWVRVDGHYQDPAAVGCVREPLEPTGPTEDPALSEVSCRQRFVVTAWEHAQVSPRLPVMTTELSGDCGAEYVPLSRLEGSPEGPAPYAWLMSTEDRNPEPVALVGAYGDRLVFDPELRVVDRAGRTIARQGDVVRPLCLGGIGEVRGKPGPRSAFPERGMATLVLDVCSHDGTPPGRYRIELYRPDDEEQVVRSDGDQCETQQIRVQAGVQRIRVDPRDRSVETAYRFVGLRRGTDERREIALQRFIPGMGVGTLDLTVCDITQEEPVEITAVLTFNPIGDNGPVGQPPIHVDKACRENIVTIRAGSWTVTVSGPGYESVTTEEIVIHPRFNGYYSTILPPVSSPAPSASVTPAG